MSNSKAKEYENFENIKKVREDGTEYRSARDLSSILEYKKWEKFIKVIDKAMLACKNSRGNVEDNFIKITKNEIYKSWSGMKASEYKEYKNIRKESLRDNMTDIEIALTDLGEIATRELAKEHKPYGLEGNKNVAKMGGHAAKVAREDLEKT